MSELNLSPPSVEALHDVTGYLNAGGRGTRLARIMDHYDPEKGVAKAMLALGEPPLRLVDHHINTFLGADLGNVVVGAGDQDDVAEYIAEAYGDHPEVSVVSSDKRFGTAGDLILATREHPDLFKPTMVVVNADTIMDFDVKALVGTHIRHNAGITAAVTTRRGVHNQDGYYIDADDRVVYSDESGEENHITVEEAEKTTVYRASSTGTIALDTEFISGVDWHEEDREFSLYTDVVTSALGAELLYAYSNGEKIIQDIGTESAWRDANQNPQRLQPYLQYGS